MTNYKGNNQVFSAKMLFQEPEADEVFPNLFIGNYKAVNVIFFLKNYHPGLPDGLLSYQKSQFGYILEGLGMENVGIFYDRLK
jgi:hypothetical protein